MKVKISTIENTGLGAILKSWKESVIKTEWRTHPGWRLWRNRIEDRGKRTQNTAESAQNVKPRGGEKTGCKPGFLNPTTPVSQRMLQTLKQGTHKRTHHTPRQHRCSEPSQKHCLKTQQNPARHMWEKPYKRAQQRQGWGVGTTGSTAGLCRGSVGTPRGVARRKRWTEGPGFSMPEKDVERGTMRRNLELKVLACARGCQYTETEMNIDVRVYNRNLGNP